MLALAPTISSNAVDEINVLINSIDLSMVKQKLMDENEGYGWDQGYSDHVEMRYRRYLIMLYMAPHSSIVPTKDIDIFWHQHILDTRAYANDCLRVFGFFVHHFPYFGMRGENDAKDLLSSFENTKAYYKLLFGDDYAVIDGSENSSSCHKGPGSCHKCRSGCGMNCKQCGNK